MNKSTKDTLKRQKRTRKLERRIAKREEKMARRDQRVTVAYNAKAQREHVATLLEELAAGLRTGRIALEHGDEAVAVEPSETVRVAVRARQTWKREGITVRVRWPRGEHPVADAPLRIHSNGTESASEA